MTKVTDSDSKVSVPSLVRGQRAAPKAVIRGDRRDCMRQFKAAWERFVADEANLVEFLNAKRKRR